MSLKRAKVRKVSFLLYCNAFCQVARLVDVQSADGRNMVGQELEGYDGDDRR